LFSHSAVTTYQMQPGYPRNYNPPDNNQPQPNTPQRPFRNGQPRMMPGQPMMGGRFPFTFSGFFRVAFLLGSCLAALVVLGLLIWGVVWMVRRSSSKTVSTPPVPTLDQVTPIEQAPPSVPTVVESSERNPTDPSA
jgi:hypothetical protein